MYVWLGVVHVVVRFSLLNLHVKSQSTKTNQTNVYKKTKNEVKIWVGGPHKKYTINFHCLGLYDFVMGFECAHKRVGVSGRAKKRNKRKLLQWATAVLIDWNKYVLILN